MKHILSFEQNTLENRQLFYLEQRKIIKLCMEITILLRTLKIKKTKYI